MKKIIATIFPYKLYLHIFQLERYDASRALPWIFAHFFTRSTENKKPFVSTSFSKAVQGISLCIFFVIVFMVGLLSTKWSILIGIILILQPYILITLSIWALKPYKIFTRMHVKQKTRKALKNMDHVKVIGIAGSYGKTSVKNIMYHILKNDYKVLKTPLSYNTVFGISRVVDLELDNSYDFFICEMGEFIPNDITELCDMVMPDFGIMTGINDQHLERFKNIQATTDTIFELADYLTAQGIPTVANGANTLIYKTLENKNAKDFLVYGTDNSTITAKNILFTDFGTQGILICDKKEYPFETSLLGRAHLQNILGALTLAVQIGMPIEKAIARLNSLPHVEHRFDQKVLPNGYLLIDNAYSSNSDSFIETLHILENLPRKNKILVTPGMVELGNTSNAVHAKMGARADKTCTHIILVGESDRTQALASSIKKADLTPIKTIHELWKTIEKLNLLPTETVIVLENDLPDNY